MAWPAAPAACRAASAPVEAALLSTDAGRTCDVTARRAGQQHGQSRADQQGRHRVGAGLLGERLDQRKAGVLGKRKRFAGQRRRRHAVAQLAQRVGEADAGRIGLALKTGG